MTDPQTPKGRHANRDERGSFTSGNDAQKAKVEGRVKRRAGLTKLLRDQTKNGIEVGERMLVLARDKSHPSHFKALEWIEARVCGPLPQRLEVTSANGKPFSPLHGIDIQHLLALAKAKAEGT